VIVVILTPYLNKEAVIKSPPVPCGQKSLNPK
jgi:hypothetical protein